MVEQGHALTVDRRRETARFKNSCSSRPFDRLQALQLSPPPDSRVVPAITTFSRKEGVVEDVVCYSTALSNARGILSKCQ